MKRSTALPAAVYVGKSHSESTSRVESGERGHDTKSNIHPREVLRLAGRNSLSKDRRSLNLHPSCEWLRKTPISVNPSVLGHYWGQYMTAGSARCSAWGARRRLPLLVLPLQWSITYCVLLHLMLQSWSLLVTAVSVACPPSSRSRVDRVTVEVRCQRLGLLCCPPQEGCLAGGPGAPSGPLPLDASGGGVVY
jgi:hypothetical protein